MRIPVKRIGASAVMLLLTGLACYFALQLDVEVDNESMNSDEARSDVVYEEFKRDFGGDNELVITVTGHEVLSHQELSRLAELTEWIATRDGVAHVYSLATVEELYHSASGLSQRLLWERLVQEDASTILSRRKDLYGALVSEDHKTVGVIVILESEQPRADRHALLVELRERLPHHISGEVHLVGLPILKEDVAAYISKDQQRVMPLAVLVMALILALLFKRIAGVVLPMVVVGVSLVATLGLYTACGFQLNSITSLLPPVVIVLSVSAAVHIFDAWQHEVNVGLRGDTAIRKALVTVWKPCVFTAAMTAVGLLSLVISPIPAVRMFGMFSAIGVLFSVVIAFVVLPIGLGWIRESHEQISGCNRIMPHFLKLVAVTPGRHPVLILLLAAALSLLSLWYGEKVQNNTDLIKFFKKSSLTYIDHQAVGQQLGSVRSLELLIRRNDGGTFDTLPDLQQLDRFMTEAGLIENVVRTEGLTHFYQYVLQALGSPDN